MFRNWHSMPKIPLIKPSSFFITNLFLSQWNDGCMDITWAYKVMMDRLKNRGLTSGRVDDNEG